MITIHNIKCHFKVCPCLLKKSLQLPPSRNFETIRSEANRYGVAIAGTEIIGPLPLEAMHEIVRFYLQAHEFEIDQIVETALLRDA